MRHTPLAFRGARNLRRNVIFLTAIQLALSASLVFAQQVTLVCEFKSNQAVECLDFSPDDTLLATGQIDGSIALWNIASRSIVQRSPHSDARVVQLTYNHNGSLLAAVYSNQSIVFWDQVLQRKALRLEQPNVNRIKFGRDSKTLLVGGWGGSLDLFDVESGKKTWTLKDGVTTNSIAWSPDGKRVACGRWPDIVEVFDVATQSEVFRLDRHRKFYPPVAFSPDSKIIAVGGSDEVLLTNLEKPIEQERLSEIRGVSEIGFRPSGLHFAACGYESTTIWDLATGRVIATIPHRFKSKNFVQVSLAFSHNGKYLALADANGVSLLSLP